jgi:predicted dehydrogenase
MNLHNPISNSLTRRQFLSRTALATGAISMSFPYVGRVLGANERINVACIGVNGKGDSDSDHAAACGGNMVAICDVDEQNIRRKSRQFESRFPHLKKYSDYRRMFEDVGESIDAVTVSIPDHNHGVAASWALKRGKHVYCQKPLAQTVYECRLLRRLADEKRLATQMGNQGSATPGLRRAVDVVQAGVIGNPLEVHVWTNRPIWPQGFLRPPGHDPVPSGLNWDAWIGPALMRPYIGHGVYEPFVWRGWYDFGTGALGDMACHTLNMPFRAVKMTSPTVVELEVASRLYPETYPKTTRIRYEFPAREGLPPLKYWWYDGNPSDPLRALRPDSQTTSEVMASFGTVQTSGAIIIGEKGKIYSPGDTGTQFFICRTGRGEKHEYIDGREDAACRAVPHNQPALLSGYSDNDLCHMAEWFRMMRTGQPSYSNFDIAGPLAEIVVLGCVALHLGLGRRMEWDGPNLQSPNFPEAEAYIRRNNRTGWED